MAASRPLAPGGSPTPGDPPPVSPTVQSLTEKEPTVPTPLLEPGDLILIVRDDYAVLTIEWKGPPINSVAVLQTEKDLLRSFLRRALLQAHEETGYDELETSEMLEVLRCALPCGNWDSTPRSPHDTFTLHELLD